MSLYQLVTELGADRSQYRATVFSELPEIWGKETIWRILLFTKKAMKVLQQRLE